jgi:hypothetical protein
MIKRICRECGSEMIKELTPEGAGFFCKTVTVIPSTTNLIWNRTAPSAAKNSKHVPNAVRVSSAINVMILYPGKRLSGRKSERPPAQLTTFTMLNFFLIITGYTDILNP